MCVDYTYLNRAYPKYLYPLPNINNLVDNSSGYKVLSFIDAHFYYKLIPMYETNREKTTLMTERSNYQYNMMFLGLKNVGETYQRMINKFFEEKIGETLEIYMDDMIVKSNEGEMHDKQLTSVYKRI